MKAGAIYFSFKSKKFQYYFIIFLILPTENNWYNLANLYLLSQKLIKPIQKYPYIIESYAFIL